MRISLRRSLVWLLVVVMLAAFPTGLILAQGGAITYGGSVAGELTGDAPIAIYTFDGAAGDQVSVYLVSLTPNMTPAVSLLGPDQRQLALNATDPFGSEDGRVVHIAYRLTTNGRHSLIVSSNNGATGQFVLYLEGRPASISEGLFPNVPVQVNLPPNAPPARYSFTADAVSPLTLTITGLTPNYAFLTRVYDANGQLVAALSGAALQDAGLTVPAASGQYEVVVSGIDMQTQGSVQLTLGAGGTASSSSGGALPSATPQPAVGQPSATPLPSGPAASPTPNVCQVTAGNVNVNVRTGPGTEFDAIGALFAGSSAEVIGRNSTATWYVINYNGRQAWIASSATQISGPCGNLTIYQSPPTPTPAATATPTPTNTPTAPQVSFTVNGAQSATINTGDCATVRWNVSNVSAVYYQGAGVTGGGERSECPTSTTTYTLRVEFYDGTSRDYTVTINVSGGSLTPSGSPNYGVAGLSAGFTPDPYTVGVTSGGSVDVSYLGGSCRGYATSNPDFRVQWSGSSSRLRFYFQSGGDTTLVVRAPGGSWYCNDDGAGGVNPLINVNNPPEGNYNIWVASYSSDQYHSGTLYVTELNLP